MKTWDLNKSEEIEQPKENIKLIKQNAVKYGNFIEIEKCKYSKKFMNLKNVKKIVFIKIIVK